MTMDRYSSSSNSKSNNGSQCLGTVAFILATLLLILPTSSFAFAPISHTRQQNLHQQRYHLDSHLHFPESKQRSWSSRTHSSSSRSGSCSLQMALTIPTGVVAVSGGLFAGGLHAIAGTLLFLFLLALLLNL